MVPGGSTQAAGQAYAIGAKTRSIGGAGVDRMVRGETITATQVYAYSGDGLLVVQSIDGVETAFTWDSAACRGLRQSPWCCLRRLEGVAGIVGHQWALEVKPCTAGYLTDNVGQLAHQLTKYNNLDAYSRVTVEFFQTKGDKVTEALLVQVSGALQDRGLDISKYRFTIR